MGRFALGLEYTGTRYCGWQRQQSGQTVQGCVEDALSRVANQPVSVVCAGRTDTGVHATGQVAHFDSSAQRSAENWVRGANVHLPADIRVQWAQPVDPAFHARFSARRRSYRYIILNRAEPTALLHDRVCHERLPLDVQRMRAAASFLLGEHDFTSLRAAACQAKSPVRTLYRLDITVAGQWIYLDVEANAFLHHMVRCIAGMLIAVGRGEQQPEWISEVLAARDRSRGGVNASAGGLYLVRVAYEPRFEIPLPLWLPSCSG